MYKIIALILLSVGFVSSTAFYNNTIKKVSHEKFDAFSKASKSKKGK